MTEWVTISEPAENGQAISTNSSPMTAEVNNGSDPSESPKSESVAEVMQTRTEGPRLMSQGSYAIYETPAGGWHVAYLPSGTEKTQHFEIPALAVQLFRQMQAGEGLPSPMEMVKRMMSARG
jgi:hypothetical protein